MTSTPTRIRNEILARIDALPLTGTRSEKAHALLGLALDAIEHVLVEPFPAPTSHQERPEPEDVSAHGSGRQGGMAGLSFPGRGTE